MDNQQSFKKDVPKHCNLVIGPKGLALLSGGKSFLRINLKQISGFVPSADGILIMIGSYNEGRLESFIALKNNLLCVR